MILIECVADTREQILEAAWELFAEKGFEAVSVRDVTTSAGVNLASVSYHFGGKDGLIQETVKRCLNPIYEYGIKLLEDAVIEFGGIDKIPLRHIMNCWMRPLFLPEECGVRSDLVLRLIARYLIEHDYSVPSVSKRLLTEVFSIYTQALSYHYPQLSAEEIEQNIIYAEGAAFYSGGLGLIIASVMKGEAVDISSVDKNLLMEKAVNFSLYGFAGKPPES